MIAAAWVEILKLRRSRTVWIANGVGLLVPVLTVALLLTVRMAVNTAEGPELEAVLEMADPDWQMYMSLMAQLVTQGVGVMLYSLMASFVFAREYRENTYATLVMVPVARWRLVVAKFIALFVWMTLLAGSITLLGVAGGLIMGVGPLGLEALSWGVRYIVGATWLFFLGMPLMSFLACLSRGYLAPMTLAAGALIAGMPLEASEMVQVVPWAVPGAYLLAEGTVPVLGGAVLLATFSVGVVATIAHYRRADMRQ